VTILSTTMLRPSSGHCHRSLPRPASRLFPASCCPPAPLRRPSRHLAAHEPLSSPAFLASTRPIASTPLSRFPSLRLRLQCPRRTLPSRAPVADCLQVPPPRPQAVQVEAQGRQGVIGLPEVQPRPAPKNTFISDGVSSCRDAILLQPLRVNKVHEKAAVAGRSAALWGGCEGRRR
jgi:hypothetical protein